MIEPVEPNPEFRSLAENTVAAALQDPDASNPIAIEVARLIDGYTGNFKQHVERLGRIPSDILHFKPRWPIEAVAMRLTTEAIRDTLARPTAPRESVVADRRVYRAKNGKMQKNTMLCLSRIPNLKSSKCHAIDGFAGLATGFPSLKIG
jgi:2-methylaconitate cis-trans-isomerase PrpF